MTHYKKQSIAIWSIHYIAKRYKLDGNTLLGLNYKQKKIDVDIHMRTKSTMIPK